MSKGTARRTVRIEDELWGAAQERAAQRGEDMSSVIRAALQTYVAGELVSTFTPEEADAYVAKFVSSYQFVKGLR